jgi:hypothetical protein
MAINYQYMQDGYSGQIKQEKSFAQISEDFPENREMPVFANIQHYGDVLQH